MGRLGIVASREEQGKLGLGMPWVYMRAILQGDHHRARNSSSAPCRVVTSPMSGTRYLLRMDTPARGILAGAPYVP
jgi:hypothetical protein